MKAKSSCTCIHKRAVKLLLQCSTALCVIKDQSRQIIYVLFSQYIVHVKIEPKCNEKKKKKNEKFLFSFNSISSWAQYFFLRWERSGLRWYFSSLFYFLFHALYFTLFLVSVTHMMSVCVNSLFYFIFLLLICAKIDWVFFFIKNFPFCP